MGGAVRTCHQLRPGPVSEQEEGRTVFSAVAAGLVENPEFRISSAFSLDLRTTEKGERPHEEETCGKCLKTWSGVADSNLSRRRPPLGGDGRRKGWRSR